MSPQFVRRFEAADRILHGFLMLSFLGLAATGLLIEVMDRIREAGVEQVAVAATRSGS